MNQSIRLDVNPMMAEYVGPRGIARADLDALVPELKRAHAAVEAGRGKDMQGWMDLPYNQEEVVADIEATAAKVREEFDAFVVLGIGGSALGPAAVQAALNHLHYNELPAEKRGAPKLYVEDNIDPERMAALMDVIDLSKTCFNVITKSGGTAETMSQYLIVTEALKAACGDDWKRHIIITTSASKGFLIKIAQREGFKTFYIPDGVGGRFSELCPVGLLAAAVCNIDIRAMLEGAKDMDERCKTDEVFANPALLDAGLMLLAMNKGANMSVMMPYADSLKLMADWYAQLWAESLGKNVTLDGQPCNAGQTPIKTLGVTDQHSQLQLYTEGPFDKVVTFLSVTNYRKVVPIPHGCEDIPDVSFLGGHTMEELIQAENKATAHALTMAGRLNYTIHVPEINAFTLGELLFLFELQTAYAGAMFNINTFNQPGVEAGKKATFALLGKPGYADKKAELDAAAPDEAYIV